MNVEPSHHDLETGPLGVITSCSHTVILLLPDSTWYTGLPVRNFGGSEDIKSKSLPSALASDVPSSDLASCSRKIGYCRAVTGFVPVTPRLLPWLFSLLSVLGAQRGHGAHVPSRSWLTEEAVLRIMLREQTADQLQRQNGRSCFCPTNLWL